MSALYVYGASDDLIEVEGVVSDEFPTTSGPTFVTVKVDDAVFATVLIDYDHDNDGEWRILTTSSHDGPAVEIIPARGEDEGDDEHHCPGYSDKAVIQMPGIEGQRVNVSIDGATEDES